ncbi:MAG: hypothetical protein IPP71_23355 [Bacteroidetes bacterium]|nr:hypothetical protein [Bacteroidota bacterium]
MMPGEKEIFIPDIQIDEPVADVGNDLRNIHSLSLLNYHPTHVYKGSLVIFRTSDPIEAFFDESLGWKRLITGTIETTVIDGCNNDTIITDEPYNAILSIKLKEYLDKLPQTAGLSSNKRPGDMFSAALL